MVEFIAKTAATERIEGKTIREARCRKDEKAMILRFTDGTAMTIRHAQDAKGAYLECKNLAQE